LKRGYDIVYGDLDMSDKIVFPASWNKLTKKTLNVSAMKVDQATECITEIYRKKLLADNADDIKKNTRDSMEQFVIEFFENKYGCNTKRMKKQLKGLMKAIREHNRGSRYNSWLMLFCRLCGGHTPSGRITALPHGCTNFVCDTLEKLEPVSVQPAAACCCLLLPAVLSRKPPHHMSHA
jgi:hypothetical protein